MRKQISLIIICLTASLIGALWHRHQLPPIPQFRSFYWKLTGRKMPVPYVYDPINRPQPKIGQRDIQITRYTARTRLFIDRTYFDEVGDRSLEGLFLVQFPRHHKKKIIIKAKKLLTVYRIISPNNDNNYFYDNGYKETDIKVKVICGSTMHTQVIKKTFEAGTIELSPGGPISSSPILISIDGELFPELGLKVIDM